MRELLIKIEINGVQTEVGSITGNDPGDAVFCYAPQYLTKEGARPISIHLPLKKEPFSPEDTAAFFEGLLPEGFTRRSVASWLHEDENDYLSILSGLGHECIGAIQVVEGRELPDHAYREMTMDQVRMLAEEGSTVSTQLITEAHLSLTGASGKAGLYHDDIDDRWYLPIGDAPSTHIVKQSHVRLDQIVLNEQMTMLTAGRLGLEVAGSSILKGGEGHEDVLLAIRRFDRDILSDRKIDGLPCPYRRHQEDMAQALGIHSRDKYEKAGEHHLRRMADIIRAYSSDPLRDVFRLWDLTVFNWLTGNTDNHLKNHSLLYSQDLQAIRLAPAYDLVSTAVYPASTRNMAFGIGGRFRLEEIDRDAWERAARDARISTDMAMRHVVRLASNFEKALNKVAEELKSISGGRSEEIADRIMHNGGIASYK